MEPLTPNYIAFAWLIAGMVFIALEAFGIPGIGFFFAGLGAITTGVLIHLHIVEPTAYAAQAAWFSITTVLWAVALWKPAQKFRLNRKAKRGEYRNMVGDAAEVSEKGLRKGEVGEVIWSGTRMRAELTPHSSLDSLTAGGRVIITDIQGNTLIVRPA